MEDITIQKFESGFDNCPYIIDGVEIWLTKDVQKILGYKNQKDFDLLIQKAKQSCINSGHNINFYFADYNNNKTFALTRYACYLIVQNDDNKKEVISFAQKYFAVTHSKANTKYENFNDFISENFIFPSNKNVSGIQNPYAIKQLRIQNFNGINNIHITDIPTNAQWIFLTGENGFGKTSVLQAIVIGLFGNKDDGRILDKQEKIKTVIELKNNKIASQIQYFTKRDFLPFGIFASYGAARLNKSAGIKFPYKTHNLFNTYGDLLDIEDKMIMWEGSDKQTKYYQATKKILLKLMSPYVEDLKVERIGSKTDVVYKETDSENYKGFLELASGFRSIIAMIGDMLIRLSEEQPEIDNFEELAGIVIIDEFDLHLHPKMQRELVERLTNTFKNIQFIVSTHSPIPLLGAPPERTVILKVNRTKEEGITIRRLEKLEKELKYLLPNHLLTSDIFGLEEIENVHLAETELDKVAIEDKYDDIEENKKMMQELEELAKNNELFPKDLFKTKNL